MQLAQIVDWARAQNAQIVVVIWPFLDAPDDSVQPARQVEQFFAERAVPVINMLDATARESPAQLEVGALDVHPNVHAHHLAAQALYDLLTKQQ